jgi:nucleotide-binding universal stress UspA family protein
MIRGTSVLCPIDFSDNSRGALRYAAVIASSLGARLMLLTVNDTLLVEASELAAGPRRLIDDTVHEVEAFCRQTFDGMPPAVADLRLEVAVGKPATEILRLSRERGCDLIVMGSHGSTGCRKLFFGSTTERVLRETTVPVLVTPAGDMGPSRPEDVRAVVRHVLAPVDLTAATAHQLDVGQQIVRGLGVPLLVLHVIEPVRSMVVAHPRAPKIDAERRYRAERELEAAVAGLAAAIEPEAVVAYGEPAEEIAKFAHHRDAGLIVMGLHSSPVLGPRMGSVTYRVLCLATRMTLALPPQPAPAVRLELVEALPAQS